MKIILPITMFLSIGLLNSSFVHAQQDPSYCKVTWENLAGTYTGDCKKGFADGKGEAKGFDHYTGSFKAGKPNGNGTYYYGDTLYHTGNFQDGIREGKGESHYLRKDKPDSVVKGYWSADVYRGKRYTTYRFSTTANFDLLEISPSANSGNSVTIEIATTSGAPNGVPTRGNGSSGYVLTLKDLISPTGSIVKSTSKLVSTFKTSITFELREFPCTLFGTLSSSEVFELELYN